MQIADIHVGHRHRRDLGNIRTLADSIRDVGLLHLPVVTTDWELVCGLRRIEAAKLLGWTEIDVRVIDPENMLAAEHDENEVRKEFTPSERVAIAKAIEKHAGQRRGRPEKEGESEIRANCPEFPRGQRTADVAAKRAGFESRKAYDRAAKVVDNGTPELVEAMDRGDVSISAAATIAELPPVEQEQIAKEGPGAVRKKAAEIRRGKSKVNGVVTEDPPDVAEARARGRIAADVVVEVTEPETPDEPAPVKESTEDDLTDDAWLGTLPLCARLEGNCLKAFKKDALYYRRLDPARKTFQHHESRVPGSATQPGRYAYLTKKWLRTDHPKHWLLCPTPEHGGCGGSGQLELIGQCRKCNGKGYWIK